VHKDGGKEISDNTATRDFKTLVDAGLLDPRGDPFESRRSRR
jgi:Fic family protein